MKITWNELVVDLKGQDVSSLLSEWQWLIGTPMQLRMVSSLGDAFLEKSDGSIHWLDVGAAQLKQVAANIGEFNLLRQQSANADEWFAPHLVGDLIAGGSRLAQGQCYSYKVPLTLGGQLEPENLSPTDLSVHFSILGQVQERVKDLPEGTEVLGVGMPSKPGHLPRTKPWWKVR